MAKKKQLPPRRGFPLGITRIPSLPDRVAPCWSRIGSCLRSTRISIANASPSGLSTRRPAEDARFKEPPLRISGDADRYNHRTGNDDYTQPGNLYRLLPKNEKERLHKAIAGSMAGVPQEIIVRELAHFAKADPAYAEGVKKALAKN